MWKKRELKTKNQYEDFIKYYVKSGGFPLDMDYIKRSTVCGIFNLNNHMIGGYIINRKPPFRTFNDMPPDKFKEVTSKIDMNDCFEIMCLWYLPSYRKSWQSVACYRFPFWDVMFEKKKNFILSVVSEILLKKVWMKGNPEILYQGVIKLQNNDTMPKYILNYPDRARIVSFMVKQSLIRIFNSIKTSVVKG